MKKLKTKKGLTHYQPRNDVSILQLQNDASKIHPCLKWPDHPHRMKTGSHKQDMCRKEHHILYGILTKPY